MRRYLVIALTVAACGPSKPGPQADVTYFWKLNTSPTVDFNSMCSDDPKFRMLNGPPTVSDNDYVVYKASDNDKQATLMACTALDPTSCTPDTQNIVFDVAGAELNYNTQAKSQIGMTTCNLLDTQVWLLTDMSSSMTLTISDTFSLVDDQAECDQIQASQVAASPNMQGYQGCTITVNLSGTRGGT